MSILQQINFKQPKYVLPAILYPLLLATGWCVIDIFNVEIKDYNPKLEETEYLNSKLPTAEIKGDGIGNRSDNLQQTFKGVTDLTAVNDIGDEEQQYEDYSSKYSAEEFAALDRAARERTDELLRMRADEKPKQALPQVGGKSTSLSKEDEQALAELDRRLAESRSDNSRAYYQLSTVVANTTSNPAEFRNLLDAAKQASVRPEDISQWYADAVTGGRDVNDYVADQLSKRGIKTSKATAQQPNTSPENEAAYKKLSDIGRAGAKDPAYFDQILAAAKAAGKSPRDLEQWYIDAQLAGKDPVEYVAEKLSAEGIRVPQKVSTGKENKLMANGQTTSNANEGVGTPPPPVQNTEHNNTVPGHATVRELSDNAKVNSATKVKRGVSASFNTISKLNEEKPLIQAIVDEEVNASDGSRIRLRLLDDIDINGSTLKKGAYLYATVSGFGSQRVQGSVTAVMIDGMPVRVNLTIYDMDGQAGLYVPKSSFRQNAEEIAGQALQTNLNVTNGMSRDGIFAQWGSTAIQSAMQRITQAISQAVRKNKATIKYGTFIYLINGNNQPQKQNQNKLNLTK